MWTSGPKSDKQASGGFFEFLCSEFVLLKKIKITRTEKKTPNKQRNKKQPPKQPPESQIKTTFKAGEIIKLKWANKFLPEPLMFSQILF